MNIVSKLIEFFIKKKVDGVTGEMSKTSKTKIFITIEALLRAVEFISPYFGNIITVPENIHQLLYTLAGLSYAERSLK